MRIDTIAIDGFGQFHGAQLEPHAGLTVIGGPNEAGKTTLLAFTRAMLFGFETHRYPALNGGKRGGWLDVVMADGRALRVERYGERGGEGKLRVIENDEDLGPGQLATILQGVETSVYQNIFAFGLGELTRFETLKDDEVAARIYGAGLGTGGVSGLKVEGALRERMEALFKSGGSKPELNGLLKRLEEIERDLEQRDLPREYAAAGARLREIDLQLDELGARYDELERQHRRQQRLQDGWETWLTLHRVETEREELGDVHAFEAEVLERLSVLEAAATEADQALEVATRGYDRAQAKLDEATLDEATLAQRDELEELGEATKVETAHSAERERTKRELTEARAAVETALGNLGTEWTIERVEDFDDSIAVKADISGRWRTSLSKAELAVSGANDALAAATQQAEEADERAAIAAARVTELDEALAGRPASEARERSVREVERLAGELRDQHHIVDDAPTDDLGAKRTDLEERRAQGRELAEALRSRQNAEEQLPALRTMADDAASRAQRGYLPPIALGIGGVVTAVVLALLEMSLAASAIVAAAGVGGAIAWIVVLRMQQGNGGTATAGQLEQQRDRAEATISKLGSAIELGSSPSPSDVDRYLDGLEEERRSLERDEERQERAREAERTVARLSEESATASAAAGLAIEPSNDDMEAAWAAIATDREQEAARASAIEREEQLKSAAEAQTERVADLTTAAEKRAGEAAAVHNEWEAWLDEHGLERGYDRETAGRVVDSVTAAKAMTSTLCKAEGRAEELAQEHARYVEQVNALAPLLGAGAANGGDVAATATLLARSLADALTAERARNVMAGTLEDNQTALALAVDGRDAAGINLSELLDEAAVADAATLRSEFSRTQQAARLEAEATAARTTLTTLSAPGKALQQLIGDLEAVEDIADVQAALSGIAGDLGALDGQRDQLNQAAGGLSITRKEMESDAAATALRQEREDLLSQLQAGAGRWSVLAVAHHILNRSRSAYEAAHRPAVIEKAEHFFAGWTDGRYQRIVAPLGEDVRGIERVDGVEVPLSGLSRGTSEQLYLALRFGLVQHFVETSGEPLPIVMDDILVNFDGDRAAQAARSIEELSKTCQVIYFTCHETTPLNPDLAQPLPRIEVN